MTPFATVADLAKKLKLPLGPDQEDAALRALTDASTAIQDETHQTLTFVADDVIQLHPQRKENEIWLPETPVTAVSEIHVAGLKIAGYEVARYGRVRWPYGSFLVGPTITGMDPPQITVKYSHGFEVIPDRIVSICVSLAARLFVNPLGLARETAGNWDGHFVPNTSIEGPGELTKGERRRLTRYRLKAMN